MSDIWWGHRAPGEQTSIAADNSIVLGEPDWINIPNVGPRKVIGTIQKKCVANLHDHIAKHYQLEGDIAVCECTVDNLFFYYRH